MPFPHKNKNPAARITSKRQDFLTKKGISTANPSYVPRKLFFLISCIYYTRFSGIRKFLPDFFSKTKAPDFFQGKMHFSSQIFQFFTNYFFRILIIFCFRIKIYNFSGFRNLRDYLAFFVIISCITGIHEPEFFFLIKEIAPDFSPLALPSGSLVQEFSDFFNYPMNFSSLSFLIFFLFFFALLVHVRKVQPADSVSIIAAKDVFTDIVCPQVFKMYHAARQVFIQNIDIVV